MLLLSGIGYVVSSCSWCTLFSLSMPCKATATSSKWAQIIDPEPRLATPSTPTFPLYPDRMFAESRKLGYKTKELA